MTFNKPLSIHNYNTLLILSLYHDSDDDSFAVETLITIIIKEINKVFTYFESNFCCFALWFTVLWLKNVKKQTTIPKFDFLKKYLIYIYLLELLNRYLCIIYLHWYCQLKVIEIIFCHLNSQSLFITSKINK
jgi:hypothetical protein